MQMYLDFRQQIFNRLGAHKWTPTIRPQAWLYHSHTIFPENTSTHYSTYIKMPLFLPCLLFPVVNVQHFGIGFFKVSLTMGMRLAMWGEHTESGGLVQALSTLTDWCLNTSISVFISQPADQQCGFRTSRKKKGGGGLLWCSLGVFL